MRNSKEIGEEFLELKKEMETLLDGEHTDEQYDTLYSKQNDIQKELDKAQAQEQINVRAASLGNLTGGGEKKELTIMAKDVNFAKSIFDTREGKQKVGLEAEVQSISDAEKAYSGIENRDCYQGENLLATIPAQFIKYGPNDPRLDNNGNLQTKATIDVGTEGLTSLSLAA